MYVANMVHSYIWRQFDLVTNTVSSLQKMLDILYWIWSLLWHHS